MEIADWNDLSVSDWETIRHMLDTGKTDRLYIGKIWKSELEAFNTLNGRAKGDFHLTSHAWITNGCEQDSRLRFAVAAGSIEHHSAWGHKSERMNVEFIGPDGLWWWAHGYSSGYCKAGRYEDQKRKKRDAYRPSTGDGMLCDIQTRRLNFGVAYG